MHLLCIPGSASRRAYQQDYPQNSPFCHIAGQAAAAVAEGILHKLHRLFGLFDEDALL